MSDRNVHKAGFTSAGIKRDSLASKMMSQEARASGGGVLSGGPTATLQEKGATGSTHSSGFTSSGISAGSKAAEMMSREAKSHGGEIPRGSTTATCQSI
ncbi:IFI27 protein, partial [Nothocercus julius]|nr:IFI27 protein [Nothocercus julius]